MKRRYLYISELPYFHMFHHGQRLHIINTAAKNDQIFYLLPSTNITQKYMLKQPARIIKIFD